MSGTKITLEHPEAHEKLTAKLFWKRTQDSGYNDAGNVKEYADATSRSLVTRAVAKNGFRTVNDEQTDLDHPAFTFLLDERVPDQELLLRLARQLSDQVQLTGEGQTATITSVVEGKWHLIGSYNIANVVVNASISGTLEEGTDYDLDKENGRIFIIADAGVGSGETLTLTFDQPNIAFEKFESGFNPLFYCDIVIEEHNQFSRMFLRKLTFKGNINVTEFPAQTGEMGVYRVKVTPSTAMTIVKRPEAQTLPSHAETGVAANSSSSSSSTSATTSQSSTSVSS